MLNDTVTENFHRVYKQRRPRVKDFSDPFSDHPGRVSCFGAMSNSNDVDFLDFDDSDIDWDSIMEEGGMEPEKRSAQAVQQVPSQTSTIKPAAHSYACSLCSKKYKSVSGFRGHMKNVHEMRNVKVSQYRQPLEEDCSSSGSISKHTPGDGQTVSSDQITAVSHKRKQPGSFTRHMKYSNLEEKMLTYVTNACEGVGQDPNLAFEGSVFGNEIAAIGKLIAAKLKGDKFMDNCIMELLCQQLWKTATAGESMKLFSSHMEEVWHTFFNFWVDEDITQQLSSNFLQFLQL
ncbi:uncharacterized protein [Ptychodera flava]|uniref:uncharacterized protein n=1 Tax=Ptychodera flava TaxID=63121 RepID=UPI00396A3B87